MERQEIYRRIQEAKNALSSPDPQAAKVTDSVTADAHSQYLKVAKRIFGTRVGVDGKEGMIFPHESKRIIAEVQKANTKATLRKYARSIRHIAIHQLNIMLNQINKAQRNANWVEVENVVSQSHFEVFTELARMLPQDFSTNWVASRKRKGKKSSTTKLPNEWREQMAAKSTGQFRLPMMVSLMTGCRPSEIEKGVRLKIFNNSLFVQIKGAKVKENAGQETRQFQIADHSITNEIMSIMKLNGKEEIIVKVANGNSVTTHMRNVAKKLWPNIKESITVYTSRHAMAADCKTATKNGAEQDLVSKVLGHAVDKTSSYYGTSTQSRGGLVAPSKVVVPKEIKHKATLRSSKRMEARANQNPLVKTSTRVKLK